LNHLLFHKSLIDEENDMSRINEYMQMAKQAQEGMAAQIENVFDRSVMLTFELVLQQDMDPWNIDLVKFSTMYLKNAKDKKVDLLTAGRIIYMAWKVLRLQSDHLVIDMEKDQYQDQQVDMPFGWDDLPLGGYMNADDGYSYANLVVSLPQAPIEPPMRREGTRKVSLIELLGAFDAARHEAEEYQLQEQRRVEERTRLQEFARKAMKGTAHEDHLEKDINEVWKSISNNKKKQFRICELYSSENQDDRIKTFLSVLFLAYNNKIRLYQKQFPFGEIYIKNLGYT
jgi:segregation and condensation protein A